MRLLLDTHAILWAMGAPERLGERSREFLQTASPEVLYLSDISLLEVSLLAAKGRIECQEGVLATLELMSCQVSVIPINPAIATRAMQLALPQSDPFDRIIVATAMELRVLLCTRDQNITRSGLLPTLW